MILQQQTPTISMMDLRRQPGTLLDRVFYRRESFIVERAGEAKAAIIPIREYQDFQRIKQEARARFLAMTQELRIAFANSNRAEVEQEIMNAIKEVRTTPTSQ